jgi:hypothetical protein
MLKFSSSAILSTLEAGNDRRRINNAFLASYDHHHAFETSRSLTWTIQLKVVIEREPNDGGRAWLKVPSQILDTRLVSCSECPTVVQSPSYAYLCKERRGS